MEVPFLVPQYAPSRPVVPLVQRRASRGGGGGGGADDDVLAGLAEGGAGRLSRHASRGDAGAVSSAVALGEGDAADARKRRRGGAAAVPDSDDDHGVAAAAAVAAAVRSPSRGGGSKSSKAQLAAAAAVAPTPVAAPFSIALAAGVERLAPQERTLCEHLRLLPHQYQQIKATVFALAQARGHVREGDAAEPLAFIGALGCLPLLHGAF